MVNPDEPICHCCEMYMEIFAKITEKNNCFFEHVSFDCIYCETSCRYKGFKGSVCEMLGELKSVCHCCQNDKHTLMEEETNSTSIITTPSIL